MRRPFFTVLVIAASLVALVLGAAAIAVRMIDVNTLAGPIRERIRNATGRDLRIDGGVHLKLSLEPRIEMRDVTLSNAPWATDPALITAKRLDAELALLPLIRRQLDVRQITLTEPVISLETSRDGKGNWELGPPRSGGGPDRPPGSEHAAAAIIGVGDLIIDRGTLVHRNDRTGAVTRVAIEHFALHARDLDSPVNATFRGSVDDVPVALTGTAGPLSSFMAQRWPYPLDVEGDVANRKIKAETKLAVDTSGTRADDLRVTLGGTTLSGNVAVARNAPGRITLRLQSSRLQLADFELPHAAGNAGSPVPTASPSAAKAPPPAATVIPDTPLPLGAIAALELDADIAANELVFADGKTWRGVHARLTSSGGRVDAPLLEVQAFGGTLRATLHADGRNAPPQVHLTLNGDGLELAQLLASLGVSSPVHGGKTELRADITSHGVTPHDIARHASGSIAANIGPATLTKPLSKDASAMTELLGTVLPVASVGSATEIRCAVIRLPLRDGVAHVERSIGIETDKVGLLASGTIDFARETLDLSVRPSSSGGGRIDLGQLAGLIHWRGPWRTASVTLDPATSAGAVAGAATLLAGGTLAFGPIAGMLVPKVAAAASAPQASACTIARGAAR